MDGLQYSLIVQSLQACLAKQDHHHLTLFQEERKLEEMCNMMRFSRMRESMFQFSRMRESFIAPKLQPSIGSLLEANMPVMIKSKPLPLPHAPTIVRKRSIDSNLSNRTESSTPLCEFKESKSESNTPLCEPKESNSQKRRRTGKQCAVLGCTTQDKGGGLCAKHGGGHPCKFQGCSKIVAGMKYCSAHGGKRKKVCSFPGCKKGDQGGGLCASHGGGRRCTMEGCSRRDVGRGLCWSHGGGKRCAFPLCLKCPTVMGYCKQHKPKLAHNEPSQDVYL